MEARMNKEIRSYSESIFFGLSIRQFVFSMLAVLVAVGLYFWLEPLLGGETVSWICILGALPFAAMGFVTYHGMTAEKLLAVWVRDQLLEPRIFTFKGNNLYFEMVKDRIKVNEKEEMKRHD